MDESVEQQRLELRARRAELERLGQQLQLEGNALDQTHDVAALRAHSARLRGHLEQIHAFIGALEEFHRRVGPIGH